MTTTTNSGCRGIRHGSVTRHDTPFDGVRKGALRRASGMTDAAASRSGRTTRRRKSILALEAGAQIPLGSVERSLETQVSQAVDAWLRWLPRWEPATHRGRVAPCRRCFGSPVLSAAGLGADVPHGVQHGLSTRIKTIIDHSVAEYTALNLPMLQSELEQQASRNRARSYRPAEGLDPEYEGLPLDPDPVPGAPFLFTISGLAEAADADVPDLPPLSPDAKAALRQEVGLADDYANMIGREVCTILLHHRLRIQTAIGQYVEPQIEAMLEELTRSLDAPFDPRAESGE